MEPCFTGNHHTLPQTFWGARLRNATPSPHPCTIWMERTNMSALTCRGCQLPPVGVLHLQGHLGLTCRCLGQWRRRCVGCRSQARSATPSWTRCATLTTCSSAPSACLRSPSLPPEEAARMLRTAHRTAQRLRRAAAQSPSRGTRSALCWGAVLAGQSESLGHSFSMMVSVIDVSWEGKQHALVARGCTACLQVHNRGDGGPVAKRGLPGRCTH